MTTGVIITLIICGTLILLSLIGTVGAAIKRHAVAKQAKTTFDGLKNSLEDIFKED